MVKLAQKISGMSDGAKSGAAKIILLLSTVLWGSSYFVLKDTLDEVPPYFLLSFRFLVAAPPYGSVCTSIPHLRVCAFAFPFAFPSSLRSPFREDFDV